MNRIFQKLAIVLILTQGLIAPTAPAQGKKTPAGEEFFIVASIDQSKAELLLKRPTEVTMLAKITGKAQCFDENGKPIHSSDLRAGDTVWVVTSGAGEGATATRIRKGPMTVADLHKYYLDYPVIK